MRRDKDINRVFFTGSTAEEETDDEGSEGAYIFKPEWRNPLPVSYGKISDDVVYQKG